MSDFAEHVYEAPNGLIYVTRWTRRQGYDVYDLTCIMYDVRDGKRLSWYWANGEWTLIKEGEVVPAVFSLPGNAAQAFSGGRPTNMVEMLTGLLHEIIPVP